MPDIAWNKSVWDRDYKWSLDGDEWTEFSLACGAPYETWKDSLARTFLIPYLKETSVVVEIGPGHGRWTVMIPPRIQKGTLYLVDISRSCIEYCRKRLGDYPPNPHDAAMVRGTKNPNIQYRVTGGRDLQFCVSSSVDFVFAFDTFVHVEESEVRPYVKEFFRVLKPQGMGVIHHVGNPTPEQRQNGARSQVSGRQFGDILRDAGFFVIRQTDEWAGGNLKLTGDVISIFVKP